MCGIRGNEERKFVILSSLKIYANIQGIGKKIPYIDLGGWRVKKGLKKVFDGEDQISFGWKNFFIIINIYRYNHVKIISANIESSMK